MSSPAHTAASPLGSGTPPTAIQLGAATGVAVSGSLLSDSYRDSVSADPRGAVLPTALLASVQESLGTALTVARHLPGGTAAPFVAAAREAFVDGLGPAMVAAFGVTALGIVAALAFAPSRTASASHDRDAS